ncbi:MAG: hypothetical protein RLZZ383_2891 [Pseudomonadota bacterium]
MRHLALLLVLPLALSIPARAAPKAKPATASPAAAVTPAPEAPTPPPRFPAVARGEVVDDFYGTPVADPYRWLEDMDSEAVRAFVEAQNDATRTALDASPHRKALVDRLQALWTFERWGLPIARPDRLFYEYNDGTWDQPRLMVEDAGAAPRALLDVTTLRTDGTVSVQGWKPSDDGRYLAWGLADAGSDWQTWRIRDVATGQDLPDELRWVKFSECAWLPDSSGFFYARFPEPKGEAMEETLGHQALWFHRVGTPQSDDVQIVATPEHPTWGFAGEVSADGQWLVVTVTEGTAEKNLLWAYPLRSLDLSAKTAAAPRPHLTLFGDFDAAYAWVGSHGNTAWIHTDKDAPTYKLVAIDLSGKKPSRDVLPASEATLQGVSHVGGQLVARWLRDAKSEVTVHTTGGKASRAVALPDLGTASGFAGGPKDASTFVGFTSFTQPFGVWRYDLKSGALTPWHTPKVAFDPAAYETTQVWYTSKDGTKIPMFITAKKGTPKDGHQPTLLYGYGGFNIPLTPTFKVPDLAWLDQGGVFAVPNLRGGGEYGRAWHEAGTKEQKQNVFDDFIAAAEHLIATGWTEPSKLAIHGRSNGGLLAGATVVQRPDLFAAAVPSVGVLDMLRYHRFTIGWAWASDYGRSDDNEAMFRALYAYSPVHKAKPAQYPAILVTTGDHDDRVVPAHSYKFAAALQAAQQGDAPILLRVETRAGHGAGPPVRLQIEEVADRYAFLLDALKVR